MKKSKIRYFNQWPTITPDISHDLLIADPILLRHSKSKKFLSQFKLKYFIPSGESSKDLWQIQKHLLKVSKLLKNSSRKSIKIYVAGGGSIGDLGGFIASIYLRGVTLIHLPSTWLSAVDSSHGGKTGLNIEGVKNQIGSFYPASEIWLIKPLLFSQPMARLQDSFGEILKTALIKGGSLWKKIELESAWNEKKLWELLPALIAVKYQIVQKDPLETTGERYKLNFGHTVGHVYETIYKEPHGVAVLKGLFFAVWWSYVYGHLSAKNYFQITYTLMKYANELKTLPKQTKKILKKSKKLLGRDKKNIGQDKVNFVFTEGPGKCLIESVSIDELQSALELFCQYDNRQ